MLKFTTSNLKDYPGEPNKLLLDDITTTLLTNSVLMSLPLELRKYLIKNNYINTIESIVKKNIKGGN